MSYLGLAICVMTPCWNMGTPHAGTWAQPNGGTLQVGRLTVSIKLSQSFLAAERPS